MKNYGRRHVLKGSILICIIKWLFSKAFSFLYIKQCTIRNCTRWMKIISRKKIDKHWNISLDKITYLSLLAATAHFWTSALNGHELCGHSTAEYVRSQIRRWDGGYFKRTHIYTLKMTLLLKVLQGKAGRGSKVDICPALTCKFIKKRLQHKCFPVKLLTTPFLQNNSRGCFLR